VSTSKHDHTPTTTTRSRDTISGKDVFNALKQSVLLHFGDVGWGEVGSSLAGELFPLSCLPLYEGLILFFRLFFVFGWREVKYFSPMTNLCVVRVARGTATNKTWAALALLDTVGGGGGTEGYKVVPHVIHMSGAS
jgi:ribonuclease P/MRP protein subunit POP5